MRVKLFSESATIVVNPGHPWHDCKKPLKPALRLALNSELKRKARLKEKKKLNPNGVLE